MIAYSVRELDKSVSGYIHANNLTKIIPAHSINECGGSFGYNNMNFEGLFTKQPMERYLTLKKQSRLTLVEDEVEVTMIRQKLQIYGPYDILFYRKDKKGKYKEVWGAFKTPWENRLVYRVI